jgi:iron complex outermembrane receptor protein
METPNGGSLVIRGIDTGPEFQNFYNGPTVATYFGEAETTSTSINANVDLKLVDIARVEVLRGPQGTAFGNSTLGGAVRTIPVAPKLDSFEGNFSAGYSETSGPGADNYNFQAVANIPLIQDRLAIRAVAYVFSDSGYYTNLAGSDPHFQAAFVQKYGVQAFATNEQNVGGSYVPGARIAALFKATDDLRFTLSYITQKFEQNGWGVANSGTYDQTVLQVSPEQIERGQTGGMNDEHANIANALMEYDLKWADLVATYTHVTSGTQYVQPGSIFGTTSQSNPSSQLRNGAHLENVGEVRLVTKLAGAWNYIAGLYYEETSTNLNWVYDWVGNPALNTIEPGVTQFDTGYDRRTLDQQAGFGEVSWKFLPQFTLTAGARAFAYHRTYVSNNVGAYASNPPDAGETESRTGSTYRANLAYKPNDNALVYAGFSQGFRLGRPQQGVSQSLCDPNHTGFIQGTDIPITSTSGVNADSLDNYELGTKLSLFGHRLTIDADVFHMLWKDIPVSIFPVSTATNCFPYYLANAGAAKSDGAEFQANLQVTRALRADIGASYTNARLTQDTPDAGLKAGLRLPGSPKVNSNLGMLYDFMIGGHAAFVRADAIYVGPFYVNILQQPNTRAGDYVKLDASARISLRDDLNVDLYVHNATNNNAFVMRSGYALGTSDFGYRPRPRTVGMQLTTRF